MAEIRMTPGGGMEAIGHRGSWESVPKAAQQEIDRLREILVTVEIMTATGEGLSPDATIEVHNVAAAGRGGLEV